jgi:hypothetical protein
MVQVVECLLYKCEALSSNFVLPKYKKNKTSRAPVHVYDPIYLGGREQEDQNSKPGQENSF